MDVKTVQTKQVASNPVPSPVVLASAPVSKPEPPTKQKEPVPPPVRTDSVELSKESQVVAALQELIVEHSQNSARGSRAYHDETTNRFVVEVVNSNNEVIRQIPMEEALEHARRFRKFTGMIFDQET